MDQPLVPPIQRTPARWEALGLRCSRARRRAWKSPWALNGLSGCVKKCGETNQLWGNHHDISELCAF